MAQHCLSVTDLSFEQLDHLVRRSAWYAGADSHGHRPLCGRVVGSYFAVTSTRTRTAFTVGALRLGASVMPYGPADLQTKTGETTGDTAAGLSGMLDGFVIRTAASTAELRTMACQDRMSVVNAMTTEEHPTQALADLVTMMLQFGRLDGLRVLYIGEGNNTAAALALPSPIREHPAGAADTAGIRGAGADDGGRRSDGHFLQHPHRTPRHGRPAGGCECRLHHPVGDDRNRETHSRLAERFARSRWTTPVEDQSGAVFMHDLPANRGRRSPPRYWMARRASPSTRPSTSCTARGSAGVVPGGSAEVTTGHTTAAVFARVVSTDPTAPAVVDGRRTHTYADLDAASAGIAGWLSAAGVGPEDLVAVLVDRTVALPASVLGVWKAGAAYLALDPQTPRARLRAIAAQLGPAAVLTTADLSARAAPMAPHLLCVDRPVAPHPPRPVALHEDNLAYVIHTSGSTGVPKGVGVSHRALLTVIRTGQAMYGLGTAITRVVGLSGSGFDVGTGDLARTLLTGSCLVLCPSEIVVSPPDLCALIRMRGVEYAEITPSLLRPLVRHLRSTGRSLDPLRVLVVGGELYTAADFAATRAALGDRVRIVNTYGLTEAAIDSTWHEPGPADSHDGGVPIGVPIASTRVEVLDQQLRQATDGELYLSGDQLARGYLGEPAATAARFVPSPSGPPGSRRYRSGDLVTRRPGGELLFRRRVDDLVKVNGVRLSLAEVQVALAGHPLVAAVAVDLLATGGQEAVTAWVVPVGGAPVDAREVRRHAASVLPRAAVPAYVLVVPALPVTANGKVDLAALRTAYPPERAVTPTAAGGGTAEILTDLAARRLGARPGPDDDFFEMGGDSLGAAAWAADIRSTFGVHLPAADVLRHPTAAGLAVLVERAGRAEAIVARPGRDRAPLAPQQVRLWLRHNSGDDLAAYNVPFAVDLAGDLSPRALASAWQGLLSRHAALRTSIHNGPDGPWQQVNHGLPAHLPVVEVAGEREARQWVGELLARPIPVEEPSLVRAALLRLPDRYRLVACAHHLICDGESLRTLLADLGTLYRAEVGDRAATLPPVRLSYLDYSAWHDGQLRAGRYERQLDALCRRLAGAGVPPRLPRRPAGATGGDGRCRVTVGGTGPAALRALAREHRTTLFVVLLAAFGELVRRWTAQDEVLVGVPYGDRRNPETEDVVGFFVDTTAIRLVATGEATFADLLRAARAETTFAAGHRDIPYDLLHHTLRRQGTRLDLGCWFNFLGTPQAPPDLGPAVTATVVDLPPAGALFDVNVYVTDRGHALDVDVVLDTGRVDAALAGELARQYERLLTAVAAAPDLPVRDHALAGTGTVTPGGPPLRPAPHALDGAHPAGVPDTAPPTVSDLLSRRPARAPAVHAPAGHLTYGDLTTAVCALASRLSGAGVGVADTVAIRLPRGPQLVLAMLATWSVGADFWIVDTDAPAAWMARQLDVAPDVAALIASDVPVELAARIPRVVHPETGAPPHPATAGGASTAAVSSSPYPPRVPGHLGFTSGTSGTPKPVRADGRPLHRFLRRYAEAFGLSSGDRYAMLAGLGHDPLLRDVFAPMFTGACLCIPPEQVIRSPRELGGWIAAQEVTVVHLTPPLLRLLASRPQPAMPALRLVVCGGDQLYYADVQAVRGFAPHATVVNAYGATETPQIQAWWAIGPGHPVGEPVDRVPVDRGIDGIRLHVVDRSGHPAPVAEVGRLHVQTPFLADGLGDRYDTGDLGRLRSDGLVEVLGRADDRVKIAGHRAEPQDLDVVARGLPGIADARTIAAPDAGGRTRLVLCTVPAGPPPDLATVRAALRDQVPAHLLPAELVVVDALPLTTNGKLDRAALMGLAASPIATPAPAPAARTAPRSTMERQIAAEWSRVLGTAGPDLEVNFFDQGGTSLLMAELQNQLERRLGLRIPMLTLLEFPAVRRLADHLAGTGTPTVVRTDRRRPTSPDAARRIAVRRELRSEDL